MKVRRATKAGCWRAARTSAWRCGGSVRVQVPAAVGAYRGPDGLRDHCVGVVTWGSWQWELVKVDVGEKPWTAAA
jgi:hypothetical protein